MIKYYLLLFISIWHIGVYPNDDRANSPAHNDIGAFAPPANDLCANAITLTPGTTCTYTTGTFSGALNDGGNGSCGATASQDVWYKFTATDPTMKITVDAIYDLNHAIQVFQGGCSGPQLACVNTNGQNGAETVFRNDFIPGQEYYVRVMNLFTQVSTFNFNICVTKYPTPVNDLCTNAIQLTPGTTCTTTSGTFSGALNDGGTSCITSASQDVWYKFTATDPTMKVTVDAIYDLNHAIQVFQGRCGGPQLACVNTNGQNGAETVFRNDFIPGQEYYVRVINVFTQVSTFNFTICVTKYPTPVNDLCTNAIQLTPGTTCTTTSGTFSGALNDGGTSCITSASQDVWYKFTATDPTMKITVDAIYDLNHAIQVFQGGCSGPQLACVNTNGQNGAETVFRNDFIPGQEYYVRVINVFTQVSTFNFTICVTKYPLPVNDLCANAIQLTPGTACTTTSGTFSGALNDGGTSCITSASQDVWYKFTATDPTMRITVDAIYDLNHAIQVFQGGCSGPQLACVNTNGQNGAETFFSSDFIPGQEYYVRVINVFTQVSTFNFNICVTKYITPANDLCANATQLTPGVDCILTPATFNGATLTGAAPSCATASLQDIWFKFTATDATMGVYISGVNGLDHGFQILQGGCAGTSIACVNRYSAGNFENYLNNNFVAGQEYYVRVFNVNAQMSTASFSICVQKLAAPSNDLCANATQLTPGVECTLTPATFSGATLTGAAPSCATASLQDIWFKFTATDATMGVYISGVNGLDHGFQILQGGCDGTPIACVNNYSAGNFENYLNNNFVAGQEYYVRVFNINAQISIASFSICVQKLPAPSNDLCANATQLTPGVDCILTPATFSGATLTGAAPSCATASLQDIWFKFTATDATMGVYISGVNGLNHGFQILQGGCGGTSIACVDNYSSGNIENYFNYNFIIGQEYYVRVFNVAAQVSTASFSICVQKLPAPSNDLCANATQLTPGTNCTYTTGTFNGSLKDGGVPACAPSASQDVWYKFTATDVTMTVFINLTQDLNQGMEIWQGGCNGTLVACVNNYPEGWAESYFNNNFVVGQEYYIRVFNASNALQVRNFTICVVGYTAPVNDLCANATQLIPGTTCTYTGGTFLGSLKDGGAPACAPSASQDVWYKFTATDAVMNVFINLTQDLNQGMEIWQGGCNGTVIACVNSYPEGWAESYTSSNLTVGQEYYVRVFNVSSTLQTRSFSICLVGPSPVACVPSVDISASATSVCQGQAVTFTAVPTNGGTTPSYQWKIGTTNVGTNSPTYTTTTLADGNSVSVVMTSSATCAAVTTSTSNAININVTSPVIPAFTQIAAICPGGSFTLPTTSTNGITGTWSPVINNMATTTYTFTPNAGQCGTTATMTVTVNNNTTPAFTQITTICSGSSFTLPVTSTNGITGTWSPTINNMATTTYTFTPNAGQCATTATMTVTVGSSVVPVFTQIAAICQGGSFILPTTSNNGISGTWSPTVNNTATTTYTFTPSTGQCATTTTMTVAVVNSTVPSFTQIAAICPGGLFTLPATSDNGITGTWSPAVNNMATTTYTFTPNTGQCATTAIMTVAVVNSIAPSFTQIAPICNGGVFVLPSISTNGITGAWSPTVNNTATTTYTFTPNVGQCATTTTMTVTVNNSTVPVFTQIAPVCQGSLFTLPATSNNGITGTWSPAANSNVPTTYTFTPSANQCATTTTMTVEVTTIDTAVTVFANSITATTASLDATYQWINCANNQPIAGETDFFYIAIQNGSYAVVITENGCSATSECMVIDDLGVKTVEKNSWKVYPNPATDVLFIDTHEATGIVITDMSGKTVMREKLKPGKNNINVSVLSSGVYMINSDLGTHVKFIKK